MVDAEGLTLGRLASQVAHIAGNMTIHTTHRCGDFVLSSMLKDCLQRGSKARKCTTILAHIRRIESSFNQEMREKYPVEWVERAVHGMIPDTRLGRRQHKHLFVCAGSEHPHASQQPIDLEIK